MMTSLYKSTDQVGQPLNVVYAEDVGQLVDVLTGQRDAGALSLLQPLATPGSAPTVSLSSGGITGTGYQWGVYWITGIQDGTGAAHVNGRTPYGTLSGSQNLTAQQATVSISSLVPPTGAIGWGVARNKSGGGTWYTVPSSEQFMSLAGTMPVSFVDNAADASLTSAAPTSNTTGTSFSGVGLTSLYDNTISVAGTWDAQSIAQTYKHLLLVWSIRFVENTKDDYVDLRFNNDSGTNYTAPYLAGTGSAASSSGNFGIAKMYVGLGPGSGAPAGRFGSGFILVPNYASATPQKAVVSFSSNVGDDVSSYDLRMFGGVWKNTAAINRIQIFCDGGAGSANLDVGSRLTIYGMP